MGERDKFLAIFILVSVFIFLRWEVLESLN
jgi:hypothetical protein